MHESNRKTNPKPSFSPSTSSAKPEPKDPKPSNRTPRTLSSSYEAEALTATCAQTQNLHSGALAFTVFLVPIAVCIPCPLQNSPLMHDEGICAPTPLRYPSPKVPQHSTVPTIGPRGNILYALYAGERWVPM